MKMRPTNSPNGKQITIVFHVPGNKHVSFSIQSTPEIRKKLDEFRKLLKEWQKSYQDLITPWNEAIEWKKAAAERIRRYKKSGLVLRGARFREGLSQKQLAKRCKISQENLSKMENGKRPIGKKTAKRLAKALRINYKLLVL